MVLTNLFENEKIEFKEFLNLEEKKHRKKIIQETIAFINTKGGRIFIGVSDDKKNFQPFNENEFDNYKLKLSKILREGIRPSILGLISIEVVSHATNNLICIHISEGANKPYFHFAKGLTPEGCFFRFDTETMMMPQEMIDDHMRNRTNISISTVKSPFQELSFQTLQSKYALEYDFTNDYLLENLNLITDNGFNYAAFLLADKNNLSFPFAIYSGIDRDEMPQIEEFGNTSLVTTVEKTLAQVTAINQTVTLQELNNGKRQSYTFYNEYALRELILNAFIHNDYLTEQTPRFDVFENRIEITSYGKLLLSREDFFSGITKTRNQILVKVFKDLGFVEELGRGIRQVLSIYPRDIFHFGNDYLRVIIPKKESINHHFLSSIEQPMSISSEPQSDSDKILTYLNNYDTISTSEASELIDKSISTAKRILASLLNEKIIIKEGIGRGTRYKKSHEL